MSIFLLSTFKKSHEFIRRLSFHILFQFNDFFLHFRVTPVKLEIDEDLPDPELGRGNRKRKKRKFFDDHHESPMPLLNGNHKVIENIIRQDVFSPDHIVPDQNLEENSAFLKPVTANLSVKEVKKWTPNEVGQFVRQVPRLNICLNTFEAKLVQEEIDGEAFLLMTQSDMVNLLGLKLGPAIKIFNALLLVKKTET